jgi:hypothetical protein
MVSVAVAHALGATHLENTTNWAKHLWYRTSINHYGRGTFGACTHVKKPSEIGSLCHSEQSVLVTRLPRRFAFDIVDCLDLVQAVLSDTELATNFINCVKNIRRVVVKRKTDFSAFLDMVGPRKAAVDFNDFRDLHPTASRIPSSLSLSCPVRLYIVKNFLDICQTK